PIPFMNRGDKRHIPESRLLDDRVIVAVEHMAAGVTANLNEVTKELTQLRRAACDIHRSRLMLLDPRADSFRSSLVDHLCPPWTRVHVTMATRLVALSSDIDLQSL